MKKTFLKAGLTVAILSSVALGAWAEEAPVYDVDNFPPQFDGQDSMALAPGSKPQNPTAALPPSAGDMSSAAGDAQVMPSTESMSMPQRMARIEQQVNNMLHADVGAKVSDMQAQIQALRGQVEQLSHEIQEMQLQQKKMYSDLDRRLSQKSSSSTTPSPTAAEEPAADLSASDAPSLVPADTIKSKSKSKAKPSASSISASTNASDAAAPNDAEEQKIYQNAYNLIKSKKYNEAAAAFQTMLQKYPSGSSAANAHYWLGELYGLMGKNDQASAEFNTLVKTYPDSPKVADAQLKLGLIYAAQFKWPDAKTSFKKVMSRYPGTSSARLASEQLKQIKVAGH